MLNFIVDRWVKSCAEPSRIAVGKGSWFYTASHWALVVWVKVTYFCQQFTLLVQNLYSAKTRFLHLLNRGYPRFTHALLYKLLIT